MSRRREAYEQLEDGEWITPKHHGYRQQCCDCGLVHVYRFRVTESGAVEFQVRRDNRATAQVRRHLRAAR